MIRVKYMRKIKLAVVNRFVGGCRRVYESFYFIKCRRRLTNTNFSIIAPNCYAGVMYHRLGQEFLSPTINMFFPYRKQYLDFCKRLSELLDKEINISFDDRFNCPVGNLDGIIIAFNHYKTADEALSAWRKRKKRVNFENLYFIFDDIDDIEYADLIEFNKIPSRGKVIFTARKYEDIDNTILLSDYADSGKLEHYLTFKNKYTGKNPADKDFDFVDWLNTQ